MKFLNTEIHGIKIIEHLVNNDSRGFFVETYRQDLFQKNLLGKYSFCQENIVKSSKMVLRGLHFQINQSSQSKLITVLNGEILDVAVDMRKNSETFGKYFKIRLCSESKKSIFIPKGFAHGYLSLKDDTIVNYKVDNFYNPEHQKGIIYSDPKLNINWEYNHSDFIISKRDKNLPYFDEYKS